MLVMQRAHDAGSLLTERMPKPEFALGSTLRRIQDDGLLRVGLMPDCPGFSFRNDQTQRYEGLDVAVARKLAQSIFGGSLFMANRNIEFVELNSAGRVEALQQGSVDMVASVFAITAERRKLINFSDPYYGAPTGVVVRSDSFVHELTDVKMITTAATPGTVEERMFAKHDLAAKVFETEDVASTIDAVLDGDAEAGAMSSVLVEQFVSANPELRKLSAGLGNFSFGIGLPKGDDQMLEFINVQIGELVRQGYITLAELVRKRDLNL